MIKRVLLVGLVLVAGCEKKKAAGPSDCDVVSKDPANAMVELSKRYPKDPVKVAETIEKCVAPAGDICDRVAAMIKAIPSMMPGTSAPRSADEYAKTCFASPPEMRKCFLASYALAHDAECKKVMSDVAAASVSLEGKKAPGCDGGNVYVHIEEAGVWVVTGLDPEARCFGKRQGKELNAAWLETELAQFKAKDCKPSVDVSAESDVRYQDVITAMDVATKVGLANVGLAAEEDLPVKIAPSEQGKGAEHCPATVIAGNGSTGSTTAGHKTTLPAAAATTGGPDTLTSAPVVIVTKDEVLVANGIGMGAAGSGSGSANATIGKVKEIGGGTGAIHDLEQALPKAASADAPVIIQADMNTPASVLNRIVVTVKGAGYSNVLFAVKNK